MNAEIFENMAIHGNTYWWYQGKKAFVQRLTDGESVSMGGHVLDLGCGPGALLEFLSGWGDVIGLEYSWDALKLARRRNTRIPLVRASMEALPFRASSFSLVAIFDCLEHLEDDASALKDVHELLAPGGSLIVSVPAFEALRSWRDIQLGHVRRYSRRSLASVLTAGNFKVKRMFYGYFLLAFPLMLKAFKDRFMRPPERFSSDVKNLREPWNSLLATWFRWEARIASSVGLPFGTSLFALAVPEDKH